jgi:hypothetical protein
MRRILTEKGEGKAIAKMLKCTEPTVVNALRFRHRSALVEKIQRLALKRGGKLIEY